MSTGCSLKNTFVSGAFLLLLVVLIGAGIMPERSQPEPQSADTADSQHDAWEGRFVQYLGHRAELGLDNGICR